MPTMKLRLLEARLDEAEAKYKETESRDDYFAMIDLMKEHRALRGIPYEAP